MKNIIIRKFFAIFCILASISTTYSLINLEGYKLEEFIKKVQLPVIVYTGPLDPIQHDLQELEEEYKGCYLFVYTNKISLWKLKQKIRSLDTYYFNSPFALFNKNQQVGRNFNPYSKKELIEYVKTLLSTGKIPLNAQLMRAIEASNIQKIKVLLEKGANPNYIQENWYLSSKKEKIYTTPLLEALKIHSLIIKKPLIHLLLQTGANPYIKIFTSYNNIKREISFEEVVRMEHQEVHQTIERTRKEGSKAVEANIKEARVRLEEEYKKIEEEIRQRYIENLAQLNHEEEFFNDIMNGIKK